MKMTVLIAALVAILAVGAPAASARGGGSTSSGGGGSTSTSGGGGGGGGTNSGGTKDTTPAPAPVPATVPCASLTSGSATVGYYSVYAALWNNWSMRSCADGVETVTLEVINRDVADGSIDYDVAVPYTLGAGQTAGGVYDNDFAPFSTTYDVIFRIMDASGSLLSTQTYSATTPAPQ